MNSFDDRRDTFEKKFAHDSELAFRVEARCCRLLGEYLAGEFGLEGDDAKTYAKSIVAANLDEPGFEDVKRKVERDYADKGREISEHHLDLLLEKYLAEAKAQIMAESE